MYVSVIHTISDPEAFWAAAQGSELPEGLTIHNTFPNGDGTKAVCLWEAESAGAVRDFVESSTESTATNEYFEVDAGRAQGLPG